MLSDRSCVVANFWLRSGLLRAQERHNQGFNICILTYARDSDNVKGMIDKAQCHDMDKSVRNFGMRGQ